MVLAAVDTAVVLTVIVFLHGAGAQPAARSWVVPSVDACNARAHDITDQLLKDHKVRSVRPFCIVSHRGENP